MEELQRLRTSRRGYRAHTTKLLTGIAELTSGASDASTEELTLTAIEQLERKQTILEDLDTRIASLIINETDLEAEIIEAEDTRTKILTGLVRLRLKLNSCTRATPTEPVPRNPDLAPLSTAESPILIQSQPLIQRQL